MTSRSPLIVSQRDNDDKNTDSDDTQHTTTPKHTPMRRDTRITRARDSDNTNTNTNTDNGRSSNNMSPMRASRSRTIINNTTHININISTNGHGNGNGDGNHKIMDGLTAASIQQSLNFIRSLGTSTNKSSTKRTRSGGDSDDHGSSNGNSTSNDNDNGNGVKRAAISSSSLSSSLSSMAKNNHHDNSNNDDNSLRRSRRAVSGITPTYRLNDEMARAHAKQYSIIKVDSDDDNNNDKNNDNNDDTSSNGDSKNSSDNDNDNDNDNDQEDDNDSKRRASNSDIDETSEGSTQSSDDSSDEESVSTGTDNGDSDSSDYAPSKATAGAAAAARRRKVARNFVDLTGSQSSPSQSQRGRHRRSVSPRLWVAHDMDPLEYTEWIKTSSDDDDDDDDDDNNNNGRKRSSITWHDYNSLSQQFDKASVAHYRQLENKFWQQQRSIASAADRRKRRALRKGLDPSLSITDAELDLLDDIKRDSYGISDSERAAQREERRLRQAEVAAAREARFANVIFDANDDGIPLAGAESAAMALFPEKRVFNNDCIDGKYERSPLVDDEFTRTVHKVYSICHPSRLAHDYLSIIGIWCTVG
jgi:hypothetical protein